MVHRVSVVNCSSYQQDEVQGAMERTLAGLGGIERFVARGDRVLIKPNLVMAKRPQDAVTTHPSLVEALCRQIISVGGHPVIADSPGGPLSLAMLKRIYRITGMEAAARNTGARLNHDLAFEEVDHPRGKVVGRVKILKCILDANVVISFAKLKTHGMMLFTGAVKNMFGAVPGLVKGEYHFNMPQIGDFSNMLVDICDLVKPGLSLIDGIVGMEGEGPSSGKPAGIGVLLASDSPHALDYAAVSLVGIKPERVPTISRAAERGLLKGGPQEVDIVGDMTQLSCIRGFETPAIMTASFTRGRVPAFLEDMVNRAIRPKPVFVHNSCTGCGDCRINCPAHAIEMVDHKPVVQLDKCIRCFCCQELCYQKAVSIYRPWFLRTIDHGRR